MCYIVKIYEYICYGTTYLHLIRLNDLLKFENLNELEKKVDGVSTLLRHIETKEHRVKIYRKYIILTRS